MKKTLSILVLLILVSAVLWSCKKLEDPLIINEPITFLLPDTNRISARQNEDVPLSIQLTTDRAIDSFSCQYQIDTTNHGFDPTIDIASDLFKIGFRDSLNLLIWEGVYHMPDDSVIEDEDVIRLVFTLDARDDVRYQKILRIDVK